MPNAKHSLAIQVIPKISHQLRPGDQLRPAEELDHLVS